MTEEELNRRLEQIEGLREVCTFLEENPDIPLPYIRVLNSYVHTDDDVDDKQHAADLARMMKPVEKEWTQSFFTLKKKFRGRVRLDVNYAREDVCERIVTGTREVPAVTYEARTEDIVEWVCPDSLMSISGGNDEDS